MTERHTWDFKNAADALMFGLGLAGAAWEIFYQQDQNYLVYGLIIVLLRLSREVTELIRAWRGNGSST